MPAPMVLFGNRINRNETLCCIITIVAVQVIGMHVNKLLQGVPNGIFGAARRAARGEVRESNSSSSSERFFTANDEEMEIEGGDMATVMTPRE